MDLLDTPERWIEQSTQILLLSLPPLRAYGRGFSTLPVRHLMYKVHQPAAKNPQSTTRFIRFNIFLEMN